jgi:hypothetical protein
MPVHINKPNPIIKLEEIVREALVMRGMSHGEASAAIEGLERFGQRLYSTPVSEGISFHCKVVYLETKTHFGMFINSETFNVPKSQILNRQDLRQGYSGDVIITRSFAKKRGLSGA